MALVFKVDNPVLFKPPAPLSNEINRSRHVATVKNGKNIFYQDPLFTKLTRNVEKAILLTKFQPKLNPGGCSGSYFALSIEGVSTFQAA